MGQPLSTPLNGAVTPTYGAARAPGPPDRCGAEQAGRGCSQTPRCVFDGAQKGARGALRFHAATTAKHGRSEGASGAAVSTVLSYGGGRCKAENPIWLTLFCPPIGA